MGVINMSVKVSSKRKLKRLIHTKKFRSLAVIFIVAVGLILGVGYGISLLLFPSIELKGNKNIVLNYKQNYVEKGYKASYFKKDLSSGVKVDGKVNSKKLGTYKIKYQVKRGIFKKSVTRKVVVKDTEKPKLDISSDDLYVCPGDEVVPEKVKAIDNYDGDLSSKVENIIDTDKITYRVKDSSGNIKEISRKIIFKDVDKPKISLNGNAEMYVSVGDGFEDPGVSVEDNCDSDVSNNIKVDGSVNTNEVGEYQITYSATDKSGNTESVTRKVIVSNGVIYLTFDDGPNSGTTNVILDILKEEGVQATFFVTNKGPDELIKREYDEGHTVALHTASHDYAIVYASVDSYFNDLYSVQDRVKRITGEESKIIRFPGGSSNTISRRYCSGIMSTLSQEVQNRGFKYYDWNLSSGDAAGGSPAPETIYNNVVSNLRRDRVNMVLMHDIKTYTRDALRDIIRYGKNNGYRFEKITMDTEMITQRVNN